MTTDEVVNDPFANDPFETENVKRPGLLVLLSGIGTSLGTLALLFALNSVAPDVQVMGWYANYLIPVGAMLVGVVAGSGYGIASWLTGSKIGKGLMLQVVVLQIAAYFVSQYVEYTMIRKMLGNIPFSFWEYFDAVTRAFAWNDNGLPGDPFGVWGYGMRALEIAGFSLCGLIAPAILYALPYCDQCQVYMRSLDIGRLPAGIAPRKVKKKDLEGQKAYEEEQKAALEEGNKLVEQLLESVASDDAGKFVKMLQEHADRKNEIEKQTSRITISLQHCRQCHGGRAVLKLASGVGESQTTTDLCQVDLESDFVRNVLLYREGGTV